MTESDWDAYWRNAQKASIHKVGGPKDEMLDRFWTRFLRQYLSTGYYDGARLLDLACGYGAVTNHTLTSAKNLKLDVNPRLYVIDTSLAALQEVRKRFTGLNYIVSSAASLPFSDMAFDLVTSQFGVEYAGQDALQEAVRIIKPGGWLAFVMHKRDGGIYRECADNLEALDAVRQSNILHCFTEIFRTAQAVQQGRADKASFRQADAKFSGSVAATEDVFRRFGKGVADGMVFRLYNDIAHMYRRFNVYDPDEVFNWIAVMVDELDTFAGRMESMLNAALDERELQQLAADFTESGFEIRMNDILNMGKESIPSAWVLVAEKMAS